MALSFFLLLMLGHVIGDFVLQPYWLVVAKRSGWSGLSVHVGIVTFITALLVWGSIPNWVIWVIILYIGHLFIDQFRTFIFTDNRKGKGLLLLIMDQIAHFVLIVLIAWAATGWTFSDLQILLTPDALSQQRMMAYFIGLAIMIGVVPVFEAEITVAAWAAGGHEVDKTLEIAPSDRVFGGIERVAAMILILTNFWLLSPLIFLPRLVFMTHQGLAKTDRTALISKVSTSFMAAVIVSAVLYNVPAPLLNL